MKEPLGDQIHALRQDYRAASLEEKDVVKNPIQQFSIWLDAALKANCPEPTAFTLATVSASGQPSARVVLLKGFDDAGFRFFTNYESQKGAEIIENPNVAMCFLWHELERQVRIEGTATRVERSVSEAYFRSRPIKSQLGALASPQSRVLENRQVLEEKMANFSEKYDPDTGGGASEIPYPENWGGFEIRPTRIEFWQGRRSRLHDRISFRRNDDETWTIERLAP